MKFTICYLGPEWLFHLRRDFILSLQYAIKDCGHQVDLSSNQLDASSINLVIGAYFLDQINLVKLSLCGIKYININTEIIKNDMLNYNPEKVDFLNGYLPVLTSALTCWDVIADNLGEYSKYDLKCKFLRWGYHPRLEEIDHRLDKDLDYYFFGMLSPRRKKIIGMLANSGLRGEVDHSCPYFLRNDRIARSKVNLNLIQDDRYSHVNSFRICYLANNKCYTISERETDPASYLEYAQVANERDIIHEVHNAVSNSLWASQAEKFYAEFRKISMKECVEELLDFSDI